MPESCSLCGTRETELVDRTGDANLYPHQWTLADGIGMEIKDGTPSPDASWLCVLCMADSESE